MSILEQGPRFDVSSEADLAELWSALMGSGGFARRSIWLVFVGHDHRTLPMIMPIDDIPLRPEGPSLTGLFDLVDLVRGQGARAFAALLSRPGPPTKTADDRAWAAELTRTARRRRVPMWPVHLATYERVQVMAADDLIGA